MDSQETNIFSLSKQDTSVIKGIAICAMLCHHLYGCPIDGAEPYTGIFAWLGSFGKICVALFLFCSGYGLSAGYKNISTPQDKIRFIRNRFIKFYTNYWMILLLFIPLGVLVLGRTFDIAYAGMNVPKRIVFEILGINGGCSYIQAWWFNQLIIVLYLFFPILFKAVKHTPVLSIIIAVLYLLFGDSYTLNILQLNIWLMPFMIGIYWNLYEDKLCEIFKICQSHKIIFASISFVLLVMTIILRSSLMYPNDIKLDAMLTIAILLCTISTLRLSSKLMQLFAFLGVHSVNIYLIHSFFNMPILHNYAWLREGVNFFILIILCLMISIMIEWIKKQIGLYTLQKRLISK